MDLTPRVVKEIPEDLRRDNGEWGCTDMSILSESDGWFLLRFFRRGSDRGDTPLLAKTRDGGSSFQVVPLGRWFPQSLVVLNASSAIACSSGPGGPLRILRTLDGGLDWEEIGVAPVSEPRLHLFHGVVWLAAQSVPKPAPSLYRYDDPEWVPVDVRGLPPTAAGLSTFFIDSLNGWVSWWNLDITGIGREYLDHYFGLCRTTDGGEDWTCRNWFYEPGGVFEIRTFFLDPWVGWMAVTGDDPVQFSVLKTVDGGDSWEHVYGEARMESVEQPLLEDGW